MSQQIVRELAKKLVRENFKNDKGDPFEMSDGQADIFNTIVLKLHPRNQIIAPTQYGKSSVVAIALIVRSQKFKDDFAIVTGSEPKSQIIMEKVIQHTFDDERWYSKLELDPNEPLDRIRRQRTRKHLNWLGGGSIRTFTADARNRQRVKEALTGFGSPNIIEDEASLIPDDVQAMILRMLGGHEGGWLLKIGNPFYRNHFFRTSISDLYNNIFIDYLQGLVEGRYTEEFIDEMRPEAFFDVLYECKFPDEDAVNDAGWRRLITSADLERAFDSAELEVPRPVGRPRLGVDVAGGGKNWTTFVLRYDNYMVLLEKNRDPDIMSQVGRIEQYMREYSIKGFDVTVDDNGIGQGICDRLAEKDVMVNRFKGGTSAVDKEKYSNLKTEAFWLLRTWIKNNGKIIKHTDFYQIIEINYKVNSATKLKTESKDEMLKRGVQSPDVADAASMTFSATNITTADDIAFL
jgi:hypothetical protein